MIYESNTAFLFYYSTLILLLQHINYILSGIKLSLSRIEFLQYCTSQIPRFLPITSDI